MIVTPLTVVILLVACFEAIRVLRRMRSNHMALRSGLLWVGLWLAIGVLTVFPDLLNHLVSLSLMQNRLFFALVVAVVVLFALVLSLTARMDRLERATTRAHQELAIANALLEREGDPAALPETSGGSSADPSNGRPA